MAAKHETWMPLDIGAYLGDTMKLTTEQHGAYLLILMDYWRHGPPADDDRALAASAKLSLRAWKKHRVTLAKFFSVRDGHWHQKRADAELAKAKEITQKRAISGKAGASKRHGKQGGKPMANAMANGMANGMANDQQTGKQNARPLPLPSSLRSETIPPKSPKGDDAELLAGFADWYAAYPTKIGRGQAQAAWRKVMRAKLATPAELMAGLETYKRQKPGDVNWAYPATWLNGQRWLDQPAPDHGAGKAPRIAPGARPATTDPNTRPWPRILAGYKPGGFWADAWGSRPEEDASPGLMRVPRDLLDQWRADHGLPPWSWKPPGR